MSLDPSSRSTLTPRALHLFEGQTLFAKLARAVCRADCLPRKELYESWEVARRARRRLRGGRVVDLACGHALLAQVMLLLDDSSPLAIAVDRRLPESSGRLVAALAAEWPRLHSRIELRQCSLADVALEAGDVVVSAHACGQLSDEIIERAIAARARLAILPCCQSHGKCETGGLEGWLDPSLAIDVTRAARLRAAGYRVHTQLIPEAITPKNRLLLAIPS